MWKQNITGLDKAGKYRSLNGAADENIFIGKASKAGFFCFFKVWRDMPYDAVLDSSGILFRVEVKGSSTGKFDVTRGSRSGRQIDRSAPARTRMISREDCDFVVCVDSENGDCYIIPEDIIHIFKRNGLSKSSIGIYKEKWSLFLYGANRLSGDQTRDGLLRCSSGEINDICSRLGITVPSAPYRPRGTSRLKITEDREKAIVLIWEYLSELN